MFEQREVGLGSRLYSIPASLDQALKHRSYSGPGIPVPGERGEFCQRPKTQPYPFLKRHRNLEHPNPSITFYFQYTWFCITICLSFILLQLKSTFDFRYYSCMYVSLNDGVQPNCSNFFEFKHYTRGLNFIIGFVPEHPKDQLLLKGFLDAIEFYLVSRILLIFVVSCLPFVFLCLHFKLLEKLRKNENRLRIADYTIMVTQAVDGQSLAEGEFQDHFEALLSQAGALNGVRVLQSLSANAHYEVKDLHRKINQLRDEKKNLERVLASEILMTKEIEKVKSLKKKVGNQISKFKSQYSSVQKKLSINQNISHQTRKQAISFVLVSSKTTRNSILRSHFSQQKPGSRLFKPFLKSDKSDLGWAPDPDQIIWKNIGYSSSKRLAVYIMILASSILFFLVFFWVINFLENYKSNITNIFQFFWFSRFAVFGLMAIVEVLVWATKRVVYKLSCYSLYPSKVISSRNRALWLGFLRAVGFIRLFGYTLGQLNSITKVINILLKQMAFLLVLRVLRLRHLSKTVKIIFFTFKSKFSRIIMTQNRLNKIFEKPKCEIEILYGLNIYALLLLLTFLEQSPIASYLCFLFLFVNSLVSKILFYRFYAEPSKEKENLSEALFVCSGLILKIWYFIEYSDRKYLQAWLSSGNIGSLNKHLSPLASIYKWVLIGLFVFLLVSC